MPLDRSHGEIAPNGPAFYILYDVRCPSQRISTRGTASPCNALWDRREVGLDRAVHQTLCRMCGNLIMYRVASEVVEDRLSIVILSIHRPREQISLDIAQQQGQRR
jgi:hypothetical protein